MANNEIKTNAEIYREQRKERLAKAAKKSSSGKNDKIIRIIVKIVSIILVVALVLFGLGKMLTEVFCVPQKILSVATYGDMKLSVAEYNYYYLNLYNQACQLATQYTQQYGQNLSGFDTSIDPAEQEYVGEDVDESIKTWADYFKYSAHERGFLTKAVYNDAMSEEAKKAGFELTKEQKEEMKTQIDETITSLEDAAKQNDYSLDNYISKACGEGLTEDSYKELLERDIVAQYYLSWYQENSSAKATDADVKKYYSENRTHLDIASMRYFTVSYAELEEGETGETYTKKEAKAVADKFISEITDEKSFIELSKEYAPEEYKENYAEDDATLVANVNGSTLDGVSEDLTKWIMDSKRVAGNTTIIDVESQECYYILYIVTAPHKNTTSAGVDVRHLLVQADTTTTDAEGNSVELPQATIDKNFAEAKTEAEKLLKEWKKAGGTEEKFIEYVKEHTDDTASAETGGLYEDVTSESQYVPEFLDWCLDSHKKGETGIVKTDYGYHIMYYVGADKTQKWESDVRTAIGETKYTEYYEGLYDEIHKDAEFNEGVVDFFIDSVLKLVDRNVEYYASQATQSSSQISY